ncbi:MAG: OsmC family protein [Planctomycetota bacterium]|jgi:uncharacterized OsmC-like protein
MQVQAGSKTVNGVDVNRLLDTIDQIKKEPGLASFKFRAKNQWLGSTRNRSTIKEFYGAGQEDQTRTEPYVFDADEPPILLGEDKGANPVEYVLHALAACLTTTMVCHAASRGIEIESVESQLEGDIDVRGFLGLSDSVRKGYENIRVTFRVKSDAGPEKLAELAKFSPVFDTISNPVNVSVNIEKA